MKAKMLLLALAILGTTLVYSQSPDERSKTKCEKKILRKIKRKMNYVNFQDYVSEGSKSRVILTCFLNDENVVEVASIKGVDENLNTAILESFKSNPVKCENQVAGKEFTFMMTFKHISI